MSDFSDLASIFLCFYWTIPEAPPNVSPASASASASDSTFAAYASYTKSKTPAMPQLPDGEVALTWVRSPLGCTSYAAENIVYTRNFLAVNSEVFENGSQAVNLGLASTLLMYSQHLGSVAVNSAWAASSATSPSTSSLSSPSASSMGNPRTLPAPLFQHSLQRFS